MVDEYYKNSDDYKRIRRLKQLVVVGFVCLFILLILGPLLHFLESGTIIVSTNGSANAVTLTKDVSGSSEKGSNALTKQGAGGLSARVKAGEYTVTVKNRSFSTQQVVYIKARHTVHVVLNLNKLSQFEPVASFAAHDIDASPTSLYYINLGNNGLYEIGANNQAQAIDSQQAFQSVEWANASFGVGQVENGQYDVIQNGAASPLSTPFVAGLAIYSVAPNEDIYISTNFGLYRGTATGGFTKIYSLTEQAPLIVANNSGVAVFEGGPNGISKQIGHPAETTILSLSSTGKLIAKLDADAYEAAWSPNGKYLVATDDGYTIIYNALLQRVAAVPNTNVNAPVWLNNETILYGVSTGLWAYNVETAQSKLLATTALNGPISEISPSTDGSYVYISTINQQGSSPTYQLSRLGLDGQSVSQQLGELQVFLPNSVNGCGFNYINFTGTNIVVSGSSAQQQTCLQQAQTYLTQYAIDTSKLTFSYSSTDNSD